MTTFRRAAVVSVSLAAITFLAAACAPSADVQEKPTTDPAGAGCDVDESALGAAAASEIVTDERGGYCHLEVDLAQMEFTPLEDVRAGTWASETGITWSDEAPALDAEAIEMSQRMSAEWVVGDFLDGPAIELSADDYSAWIESTDLIGEDWRAGYLSEWNDNGSTGGLTVTPFTTPLVRDDAARVSQIALSPSSTSVLDVEGRTFVETCYDVTAVYHGEGEATFDFSGKACSTFPHDGTTMNRVLEGTHGGFTVTDESGTVIAEEQDS